MTAGMGHNHRAAALYLGGNGIHRVLNALAKILKMFASGSWDGRIKIDPPLRVVRIERNDLIPIQSLPGPEGELTE